MSSTRTQTSRELFNMPINRYDFEPYLVTETKRTHRRPVNVDQAKSNGFEIDTRLKLPVGFGLNASYMYRDTKISIENNPPMKDPKNHVKIGLLWNYWQPLSMDINWRLVSDGEYRYYRNGPKNWPSEPENRRICHI